MVAPTSSATVEFDAELLTRYDVAGPRYTSYPPAPSFREGFGEREYRASARASDPVARPLSLYVHIPFCESPCFYCGCTRVITRDHGNSARYLEQLKHEIALQGSLFDRDRPAVQLHLGGGTPNFLAADELAGLMGALAASFNLDENEGRDYSIELDPRHAAPALIASLADLGFNRVSLGVQDFDPAVQQAINRIQPFDMTRRAIEAARDAGMRSVNLDLIYGLPKQVPESFSRTLEKVIALRPERIALYGYAHLPGRFKAQRQIRAADLPPPSVKLSLLGMAIHAFTDAGYVYIGMDHFALPDDPLARALEAGTLQRNFQGYSTHGECDLVGLGVSAIGHVNDCYVQNARDLPGYYDLLARGQLPIVRGIRLAGEDFLRAELIQAVMCRNRIDFDVFERHYAIRFEELFARELAELRALAADGLVEIGDRSVTVTPRGRLLLRVVAMVFDASCQRASPAAAGFSRII